MSFFVAAVAFGWRLVEAAVLVGRIVELAAAVGNFHLSGINFPALGPVGFVRFLFRKRRHRGREFVNDGRLPEMLFAYGFEQSSNGLAARFVGVIGDVRMAGVETLHQLRNRFMRREI